MASQSNFRKVNRKEASDKLLSLREKTLRLIDDLAGCPDANGLVDFDMLRKTAGMMLTASYKLHEIDEPKEEKS